MSAFRFRLERLLEIRRAKEEVAQRDFAEAARAAQAEARALAALLAEEEESKRASRELRRGPLDLAALRLQEGYLSAVDKRVRASRGRLLELQAAEAGKRRALVEAMKAVKVLERFRERKLAEWILSADRDERKVLDEAAHAAREGA
ncbi:MAG TPA: flagellar export protein FliJ [Planctomycetota bacterium]